MKKSILAVGIAAMICATGCQSLKNSVVLGAKYRVEYCQPVWDSMLEKWVWECHLQALDDGRNQPTIIVNEPIEGTFTLNSGSHGQ